MITTSSHLLYFKQWIDQRMMGTEYQNIHYLPIEEWPAKSPIYATPNQS